MRQTGLQSLSDSQYIYTIDLLVFRNASRTHCSKWLEVELVVTDLL